MAAQDWHAEDVKAAVRKSGTTLKGLAKTNGYHRTAFSLVLSRPYPAIERIIAKRIGKKPEEIWPSRYPSRHVHPEPKIKRECAAVTVKSTEER